MLIILLWSAQPPEALCGEGAPLTPFGAPWPPQLIPLFLLHIQRIRVRGNIDKALNVEKILSHERERLDQAAPKAERDPTKEKGRWAAVKAKL